eukprot:CCRYP_009788-RA/>CCRYP_009788-RA protein AED:0.40 eAED:0.54 QI:0/0/0/1/0/0/2/0/279
MKFVFANRSKENAIYPLTVWEIAAAQHTDKTLDKLSLLEKYKPQLVENVQVLCKDGKLVIRQELQQRAVQWYHHYLQHPGTTRLEETLLAAMYWKSLQRSVCTFVKNCHKCQVNKRRQRKYGKLSTKLVVSNPWEVLCVDLIGPYTLKGQDGTEIDFMCVMMIDPATSWFKIVELPVTEVTSVVPTGKMGRKGTNTHNKPKEAYFDKSSAQVGSLVNKIWFSRYPCCQVIIYYNGSEFKLNFETLCDSYGIKPNQHQEPSSKRNTRTDASSNPDNSPYH